MSILAATFALLCKNLGPPLMSTLGAETARKLILPTINEFHKSNRLTPGYVLAPSNRHNTDFLLKEISSNWVFIICLLLSILIKCILKILATADVNSNQSLDTENSRTTDLPPLDSTKRFTQNIKKANDFVTLNTKLLKSDIEPKFKKGAAKTPVKYDLSYISLERRGTTLKENGLPILAKQVNPKNDDLICLQVSCSDGVSALKIEKRIFQQVRLKNPDLREIIPPINTKAEDIPYSSNAASSFLRYIFTAAAIIFSCSNKCNTEQLSRRTKKYFTEHVSLTNIEEIHNAKCQ